MEQYFEWDEAKNRKNQKKHDVSFETASLVFDDPLRISIQTDIPMVKNVGKPLEK
jgi:uncharacterized DUF497 family protein